MKADGNAKKKILFLINSLEGGGAERVFSILVNNLHPNIPISIVLLDKKEMVYEINPEVELRTINKSNFIWASMHIAGILRKNNYCAVVSFLNRSNYVNILSNLLCRHNTILSERNMPSKHFSSKGLYGCFNKILVRYLYRFADKIITVSRGVEEDLVRNFALEKAKIITINNPLELSRIENSGLEGVSNDGFFCAVGRLNKQKCFDFLIRSYRKSRTSLDLIILGEGEERKKLELLIDELGLSKRVHLVGYQKNPYKYLRKAEFFVLASAYEGLPNVLLEAMALGKAVISTDCQFGPREILAPGMEKEVDSVCLAKYGILTPVTNEAFMASAIDTLSSDIGLRNSYGLSARERAGDFCVDKIVQQYRLELLRQIDPSIASEQNIRQLLN